MVKGVIEICIEIENDILRLKATLNRLASKINYILNIMNREKQYVFVYWIWSYCSTNVYFKGYHEKRQN